MFPPLLVLLCACVLYVSCNQERIEVERNNQKERQGTDPRRERNPGDSPGTDAGRDSFSDDDDDDDNGSDNGNEDDDNDNDNDQVGSADADTRSREPATADSAIQTVGSCKSSYKICLSFEDDSVGSVPSGWRAQGGAKVVDDPSSRSGRVLEVPQTARGPRRIEIATSDLGSSHWGRIYYKVATPVPSVFVHSTLVALDGVGPTRGASEYRVVDTVKQAGGTHQFLYNVQPRGVEFGTGSPYNWRFDDSWHCAEWFIDGNNQEYRFFIDGSEVSSIRKSNGSGNYSGTDIPLSFSRLKVGWNNYQSASPGFKAWIDDLAISSEQIGCDL